MPDRNRARLSTRMACWVLEERSCCVWLRMQRRITPLVAGVAGAGLARVPLAVGQRLLGPRQPAVEVGFDRVEHFIGGLQGLLRLGSCRVRHQSARVTLVGRPIRQFRQVGMCVRQRPSRRQEVPKLV